MSARVDIAKQPQPTVPFMDDHLIYAAVLIVLALLAAGNTLGLGRTWAAIPLTQPSVAQVATA